MQRLLKKHLVILALLVPGFTYSQDFALEFSDPVPVAGDVNSYAEENYPFFTSGNDFYYVRTFHPKNNGGTYGGQDIWKATTNAQFSNFTNSSNQLGTLNNAFNNAVVGISEDGNKLFLLNIFNQVTGVKPGFSYCVKNKEGWSNTQPLNIPSISFSGDFYSANVCRDGKVVFVSMSGTPTFGDHDIYILFQSDSGWTGPLNLGNIINSQGQEISPFYHEKTGILFYASNGLGSASHDIYYTRKLDETWLNWSEPQRMGGNINSSKFEGYFTCNNDSVCAFASTRNGELSDIYLTSMRMRKTGSPATTDNNGNQQYTHETIIVRDTIFETVRIGFDIPRFMNQITNFDISKTEFKQNSEPVIDSVVSYLERYADVKVILSGHSCDIGTEKVNEDLSKSRAEFVKKELLRRGINENRIIVKWFSSQKPLAPNTSEENRQKNRRVEIEFMYP